VPNELAAVIYRLLAKKPEERFAETSQLVDAFDALPQTAEDRRQAREILKALSRGESAEKIKAAELPPLPTAAPDSTLLHNRS